MQRESKPLPRRRPRPVANASRQEPATVTHRPRAGAEERTVLVSVELVDAAARAPLRRPAAPRRPEAARHQEPAHRSGPTVIRPAFEPEAVDYVDPADLARAASQMTIAPGEVEAPALRGERPARRRKGPDEDLVVVSPSETDWTRRRAASGPATHIGAAPHAPATRRRWLWPLLGLGVTTATVVVVLATRSEPELVVTPPVLVAMPEAVEREEPIGQAEPEKVEVVSQQRPRTGPGAWSAKTSLAKPAEPTPAKSAEAPPVWQQTNATLNRWVEVAGAPPRTALGLTKERPGLTGFVPEDAVFAPTYDYRMQQREVSWEELGRFIFASRREAPVVPTWSPEDAEARAAMPATQVPWELADAYCRALGGELPSEAEWEWAARGPTLATYPWGEALPYADRVRFRRGMPVALAPVGTMGQDVTAGAKPIHDLMGNAAEWTRDVWPGDGELRAVRGWPLGRSGDPLPREGLTYRRAGCAGEGCVAGADFDLIGFRCVMR